MKLIIAPPPTPNGGLHVGHVSGPYLAADIYQRLVRVAGFDARYAVSADINQTYVDTTAKRLGKSPENLVMEAAEDIQQALSLYKIDCEFNQFHTENYRSYIKEFMQFLWKNGCFTDKNVEVIYDPETGSYPVESFVSGYCQTCFAGCSGGICEDCGMPNDGISILKSMNGLQIKTEKRLVFELESLRNELHECLSLLKGVRPRLANLINNLFALKRLPDVLVSYKVSRGLPLDDLGYAGQTLNPWVEMYPGHLYFLQQAKGEQIDENDEITQFIGFDNSFFYTFLHFGLYISAVRLGKKLPLVNAIHTNQFLYLDDAKFSTSKGHLIWATDLREKYTVDAVRLGLCTVAPEYQESSFSSETFDKLTNSVVNRINRLISTYNQCIPGISEAKKTETQLPDWFLKIQEICTTVDDARMSIRDSLSDRLRLLEYVRGALESSPSFALLNAFEHLLYVVLSPYCPEYFSGYSASQSSNNQKSELKPLSLLKVYP